MERTFGSKTSSQNSGHTTMDIENVDYVRTSTVHAKSNKPVMKAYDLSQVGKREIAAPIAPPVAMTKKKSMFFSGHTQRMDKDPFLQRLARLS